MFWPILIVSIVIAIVVIFVAGGADVFELVRAQAYRRIRHRNDAAKTRCHGVDYPARRRLYKDPEIRP